MAVTPGGRVGDATPLGKSGPRRLTDYQREIAHALMRHGHSKSQAIAIATAAIHRWAAGGGHVRPQVRAGAVASIAEHAVITAKNRTRSRRHNLSMMGLADIALAEANVRDIDLGGARWAHGWVPLNDAARSYRAKAADARKTDRMRKHLEPHYDVIHGRHRAVVTFKGNEIGAVQYVENGQQKGLHVTGFSEHKRRSEGIEAITERHLRLALKSKAVRRQRHRREGGVTGLVTGRGLFSGILAGQFAVEGSGDILLGVNGARWKHGWIPLNDAARQIVSARKKAGLPPGGRPPKPGETPHAAHLARTAQRRVAKRKNPGGPLASEAHFERHYREHKAKVEAKLAEHKDNLNTRKMHTVKDRHGNDVYTPKRAKMHRDLVRAEFERQAKTAQKRRQALFLGGLPGAGKTSSLKTFADAKNYITINPDNFKELLAKHGHVPKVKGLTPLEASSFAHDESSDMAAMLHEMALRGGYDVIHDMTMGSDQGISERLAKAKAHGYSPSALFVDIPFEQSFESVKQRHRKGYQAFLADTTGQHLGQRLVPSGHIASARSTKGLSSVNRDNFEARKHLFTSRHGGSGYTIIDNSNFSGRVIEQMK